MVCKSCCKEEKKKKKYKRGLWSPEEDSVLRSYILKYGHGKWNLVPKPAGLQRCGKSCRLRWINYLRPGLKRGQFSLQEQMTIINTHAMIGNKWSEIASLLPGRTDNEIKNLWHTHLKKQLKLNILGSDVNAHKTLGNDTLVCNSTSPTRVANGRQMEFFNSKEFNLQSPTSGLSVSLAMPLTTECSNNGFEDVKPNLVSKGLKEDSSFPSVLISEWFNSQQRKTPPMKMASKILEIRQEYSQSTADSENTSCFSYQSELLAISEKCPLSKEMNNITSSEFTTGLHRPIANLPSFDLSLPFHETILCNDITTTLENTASLNIAEDWDIMGYNEVDLGMNCDSNLLEICSLLDLDLR